MRVISVALFTIHCWRGQTSLGHWKWLGKSKNWQQLAGSGLGSWRSWLVAAIYRKGITCRTTTDKTVNQLNSHSPCVFPHFSNSSRIIFEPNFWFLSFSKGTVFFSSNCSLMDRWWLKLGLTLDKPSGGPASIETL